jgi:hypothetical protein
VRVDAKLTWAEAEPATRAAAPRVIETARIARCIVVLLRWMLLRLRE